MRVPAWFTAAALVAGSANAQVAPSTDQLLLGSTTSLENSGLLAHILPRFTALTGIEVRVVAQGTGQAPATAARAATAAAPGAWYRDIGGGMGAALNAAAAADAYTLSDRGTWLAFGNARSLRILVEGGQNLVNRCDVILLPPGQRRAASEAAARRFADWLASPDGQSAIGGYEMAGQQLFHPSASGQQPNGAGGCREWRA